MLQARKHHCLRSLCRHAVGRPRVRWLGDAQESHRLQRRSRCQIEEVPQGFEKEKTGVENIKDWSNEKKAEWAEFNAFNEHQDYLLKGHGLSLDTRKKIFEAIPRRSNPGSPFKFINDVPLSASRSYVEHYIYTPTLNYSQDIMKSIKFPNSEEEESEE